MRRIPRRARCGLLLLLGAGAACNGQDAGKGPDGGGPARPASEAVERSGESAIVLDSAMMATIELRTAVLAASHERAERELPAEVVPDPGSETTVRAGLTGRLGPAAANEWPGLGTELSAGTAVAIIGDGVPVLVPRGGTVTAVQAQPGELVQAGQGLLTLTDFSSALIRVSASPDAPVPPATLQFSHLTDHGRFSARRAGPADAADPLSRAPAWYYRAEGSPLLRPGVGLIAYVADPGGPQGGLLVPTAAVVQWDALAWAFVERSPGHFVRVRVATDFPVSDGWIVTDGFHPGDRVVVRAAGQLLSEEFRARIVVGEEVGE